MPVERDATIQALLAESEDYDQDEAEEDSDYVMSEVEDYYSDDLDEQCLPQSSKTIDEATEESEKEDADDDDTSSGAEIIAEEPFKSTRANNSTGPSVQVEEISLDNIIPSGRRRNYNQQLF